MARAVASSTRSALTEGWELAECAATTPDQLANAQWTPAQVPGTVASALRAAGAFKNGDFSRDFDASDWWFRCRFVAEPGAAVLRFEGLATIADAWLNGERILENVRSMHVEHVARVTVRAENELLIRFGALNKVLGERRPRPRWKTRLVANQQIRWIRTTLLGRVPGWARGPAPVGPFRPVWLERDAVVDADVRVLLVHEGARDVGTVRVRVPAQREARLRVGEHETALRIDDGVAEGTLRIENPPRWWPHTHGAQPLLPATLVVDGREYALGPIGFRTLAVDRENDGFCVQVNGERVFCRGVCWTPLDAVSFTATREATREALVQLRDSGMNMVRLCGPMTYETPDFHALCDELGILVFHDLMFANMDYPVADEAFAELVRREVRELASRLQTSPSLALVCGSSEIEQQIAMLGMPRDVWVGPLFAEAIPKALTEKLDVAYVTSSPTGGALPFRPNAGLAHYYGVGAYLRPLEDARRADVKFTSECLGFSNVPERHTVDAVLAGGESPVHPKWKDRVPRDNGVGWDFEDVRDHYVRELFGCDPAAVRYADAERWLALGRVTVGEVMAATFSEWRSTRSRCNGALVWFHKDLVPGAGWGIVDADGTPKSSLWYLRRVLGDVALLATDEGNNGLHLHVVNERTESLEGELSVRLYRHGDTLVREATKTVSVGPRSTMAVDSEEILGGFVDTTYAYKFGPKGHDLVVATFTTPSLVRRAFHFPTGFPREPSADVGLEAVATKRDDGSYELVVSSARFAYAVAIDAPGYLPDDDYFNLEPKGQMRVVLRPRPGAKALSGSVAAFNSLADARIKLESK